MQRPLSRGGQAAPAVGDRVQLRLEAGGARLGGAARAARAGCRRACREPSCRARRGWPAPGPRRPDATGRARWRPAPRPGAAAGRPPRRRARAAPGRRCGAARAGRARRRRSRGRGRARPPGQRLPASSSSDSTIAGSRSTPVMRHAGRGKRWRPGCQPQPTDSTSPPSRPRRRAQQLALAAVLLVVVELEGGRRRAPVEQVVGFEGLAQPTPPSARQPARVPRGPGGASPPSYRQPAKDSRGPGGASPPSYRQPARVPRGPGA